MIRCLLVLLTTLLFACKTQKIEAETKTSTILEKKSKFWGIKDVNLDYMEKSGNYNLNLKNFGYDFTLKSQDTTQPAHLTEFREGKPYREIIAKNAVYTEYKSQKDSVENKQFGELKAHFRELEQLTKNQKLEIKHLKKEMKITKLEGAKLADNFKYLLWVLIIIGVIYLGVSTGLFSLFKRVLKRV